MSWLAVTALVYRINNTKKIYQIYCCKVNIQYSYNELKIFHKWVRMNIEQLLSYTDYIRGYLMIQYRFLGWNSFTNTDLNVQLIEKIMNFLTSTWLQYAMYEALYHDMAVFLCLALYYSEARWQMCRAHHLKINLFPGINWYMFGAHMYTWNV